MQLTGFTDLALRIVMRLAVPAEDAATTTGSLAEQRIHDEVFGPDRELASA